MGVYSGERLREISFPLGGIGTGCIGLAGSGRLIDWEIFNRPNKGSINGYSHFAVKAERGGRVLDARVLNGDLTTDHTGESAWRSARSADQFGFGPQRGRMAGAPHMDDVTFTGEFPMAQSGVREPELPRRRGDGSIQSLHTAQRGRLQHPRGPVRDPRAQTPGRPRPATRLPCP